MTEHDYLLCAMNNDVLGMIKAKESGCDIHCTTYFRFLNAYHIGARYGHLAVMRQARNDGVDIHAVDSDGGNAITIALDHNHNHTLKQAYKDGVVEACDCDCH